MQDIVRVGFISSVSREAGTARVYYPDRGATTAELPLFSGWGETAFPEPGEQVAVIHLSNDTSSGVILGRFFDKTAVPQAHVEYMKQMGKKAGMRVEEGRLFLDADEIVLENSGGKMTLTELLNLRERVEALERKG